MWFKETKMSRQKTIIGLFISLLLPLLYVIIIIPTLIESNLDKQTENILGLCILWIITIILLAYIRFIEKRPFSSIGYKFIRIKLVVLAIGIGILCSIFIPLFYYGMSFLFDVQLGSSMEEVTHQEPMLIFFSIITAAITEEILMRAYPLERIYELTGNHLLGLLLSIVAFLLLHTKSWEILHILGIVLPLGVILSIIYMKTRSLLFVVIVHLIIDTPLLVKGFIN